jgi:hypothetical protein
VRMRGRSCPEAWACWLLAKPPVPECVGFKVLPIPTKSLFREETVGEQQEPPRIHAGEVSANLFNEKTVQHYYSALRKFGVEIPKGTFAQNFVSLSRYVGFRYMTVGFSFWLGTNVLGQEYWQSSGAVFFEKCLEIAQSGYPTPLLT